MDLVGKVSNGASATAVGPLSIGNQDPGGLKDQMTASGKPYHGTWERPIEQAVMALSPIFHAVDL